MNAIAPDRAAERHTQLLIRVRKHALLNEIGGVETFVPEVPGEAAGKGVGTGLGDGVDLQPVRPPLRRVEPIGDELELGNRVAAEAGLAKPPPRGLRHLLAVDVDLVGSVRAGVFGDGVDPAARRQHRQVHPVTPVHRQIRHLPRVDVRAQLGADDVDERCFSSHRHRLLHGRRRHAEVHDELLADEDFESPLRHAGKTGQFRHHPAESRAGRETISTLCVGNGGKNVTGCFMDNGDGHPRQHPTGHIRDDAAHGGFLRVRECRQYDHHPDENERPDDAELHLNLHETARESTGWIAIRVLRSMTARVSRMERRLHREMGRAPSGFRCAEILCAVAAPRPTTNATRLDTPPYRTYDAAARVRCQEATRCCRATRSAVRMV